MMVMFVTWTRLEFNTSTIAAILTILGYSINDTIVIFDRIRENTKLYPDMEYSKLMDFSNTEMLGRTIITSLTTMLCVVTLFIFTRGVMQDFALVLIVGMISGTYSTIYIATAFSVAWNKIAKKNRDDQQKKLEGQKAAARIGKPAKA
jgi:preprotein translocase subunit SecF